MKTWKWSKGEPYYKSARTNKKTSGKEDDMVEPDYDTQHNAISQSLEVDSFFNQDSNMLSITNSIFSRHSNQSVTRREDLDTKMADRELLSQRGVNPFLQTSYINDIVARDTFLKPINTTQGRVNNTDMEENNQNYSANMS
jgi:hypothetical protein